MFTSDMGVNDLTPDLRHYGFDPDGERKGVRGMRQKTGIATDGCSLVRKHGWAFLLALIVDCVIGTAICGTLYWLVIPSGSK